MESRNRSNRTAHQSLTVHPAAEVFPVMSPGELRELVDDIKKNDLQRPLTLDSEGRLLDGRNRLHACKELNIEPKFEIYSGDPIAFVISANLRRRHLNESQRGMVAARLSTLRSGQRADQTAATSIEAARKLLNVGRATVERGRQVLKSGSPDLIRQVEAGNVSVFNATKQLKAKKPDKPKLKPASKRPRNRSIEVLLKDPSTSKWLKQALTSALDYNPNEIINDIATLQRVMLNYISILKFLPPRKRWPKKPKSRNVIRLIRRNDP
jgi:ParB-like chromosome segregation protein Spo0J